MTKLIYAAGGEEKKIPKAAADRIAQLAVKIGVWDGEPDGLTILRFYRRHGEAYVVAGGRKIADADKLPKDVHVYGRG